MTTPMVQRFERIYATNEWGGGSGGGSNPAYCAPLVAFLTSYLRAAGTRSLVDIGCGDLQWMPAVVAATGVEYTGIDCVQSLLTQHAGEHPDYHFVCADVSLIASALPDADVYFAKDVLQHWTSNTVDSWLRAFFAARQNACLLVCNCAGDQSAPPRERPADESDLPLDGRVPPLSPFVAETLFEWETKVLYRLQAPQTTTSS